MVSLQVVSCHQIHFFFKELILSLRSSSNLPAAGPAAASLSPRWAGSRLHYCQRTPQAPTAVPAATDGSVLIPETRKKGRNPRGPNGAAHGRGQPGEPRPRLGARGEGRRAGTEAAAQRDEAARVPSALPRTHRAEREPLLRATGENSTGLLAAVTTAGFFLPPGRERGLGAALPRFLRADPPEVRGEAGAEGNMAWERAVPTSGSRRAPAECVTPGRGAAERGRAQALPGAGRPRSGGAQPWGARARSFLPLPGTTQQREATLVNTPSVLQTRALTQSLGCAGAPAAPQETVFTLRGGASGPAARSDL